MKLCSESENLILKRMAEGPVEWKVWDDETLSRASELDHPVCLCVFNDSSRWSHVMKSNFDEPEIVKMLNEDFMPVLADADEAPHLALAARALAQIMLGHAGWPLFIFMTPRKKPFFASSYMPQSCEDARTPGLLQVLRRIKWLWLMQREKLNEAAESYAAQLGEALSPFSAPVEKNLAERAATGLLEEADFQWGGFGRVPKFPQAQKLSLAALLYEHDVEKEKFRVVLHKSLMAFFAGGLYDHLAGGFHDYCYDREWQQPWLGKHLGQNIAILSAFLDGFRLFDNPLYRHLVEKSISSLSARFDRGDGLLYSGEDISDGKIVDAYYLWNYDELTQALGDGASDFCSASGVTPEGNYCDPLMRTNTGKNVLTFSGLSQIFTGNEVDAAARMEDFVSKCEKLLHIRQMRRAPELQQRVLTRENAHFARILARTSRLFDDTEYHDSAQNMMKNLLDESVDGENIRHSLDEVGRVAVLDDYAAVIAASLELFRASDRPVWLETAKKWCTKASEIFGADGAFRLVPEGTLEIVPAWDAGDDLFSSGNGVMLNNLVSLYELTGETTWMNRAEKIIVAFGGALNKYPTSCAGLMIGALRLKLLAGKFN